MSAQDAELHELRQIIKSLTSALAASRVPDQGWQAMETAPKDGSGILVVSVNDPYRQRVCSWTESGWTFYQQKLGTPRVVMCNPTHWMPLPPAPPSEPT